MITAHALPGPDGAPFCVHLALPPDKAPRPALVMLHEWYGLTPEIDRMAEQFAAAGFVVAAVDVYGGQVATDDAGAFALMNAMRSLEAAALVRATARWLATHPRGNGKVGVTGFCMGGALTFVAACHVPEASAFAPFYGVARADYLDPARTHGPIQAHFARVDAFASPAKAEAVVAAINAADGRAELFTYDGGHAFMRASDPRAFHPDSAALAFERCTTFFRDTLGA